MTLIFLQFSPRPCGVKRFWICVSDPFDLRAAAWLLPWFRWIRRIGDLVSEHDRKREHEEEEPERERDMAQRAGVSKHQR